MKPSELVKFYLILSGMRVWIYCAGKHRDNKRLFDKHHVSVKAFCLTDTPAEMGNNYLSKLKKIKDVILCLTTVIFCESHSFFKEPAKLGVTILLDGQG